MAAALGAGASLMGFAAAVIGAIGIAIGIAKGRPQLLRLARSYGLLIVLAAAVATIAMEIAILRDDFSVKFVAEHSARSTPLLYKVATLWSALEGSIVLWVLVLAGYIALVLWRFRASLTDHLVAWSLLTMFVVAAFFFGLLVGPADPFVTLSAAPADGPGPNPLLQNHPLMVIHPPLLYIGLVGFTVPFAFAIGALVTGRLGEGWLGETRRWTLFAWGSLTTGIVLGAWWSYEVLGWGGYWAWDPVENASFLPWLTGTAYLHSVVVQERRGMLRVWNLSLLLATFSLTIFGTFLTRSGVIESVHSFTESPIGPTLLAFFGVVVAVSLGLIGWRGDRLRSPGSIDSPLSREASFLANNLLFAAFAFVVLLGTVFPLIYEALKDDQISVGTPYFDRMTMPIGLALLFLMAVAPLLPWREASGDLLRDRLLGPAWIGGGALVVAVVLGARGLIPLIAFALAGFAFGAAARHIVLAARRQGVGGLVGRTTGGMVVHIGVVLIAVGFVASQSYSHERELALDVGETREVAGRDVTYLGLSESIEASGDRIVTRVAVQVDGGDVHHPAITRFTRIGQSIGTPSVATGLLQDVYLTVLDVPDADADGLRPAGPVIIRVIVRPLIAWLWLGGAVIAVGTVLAIVPTRRRAVVPAPETVADKVPLSVD